MCTKPTQLALEIDGIVRSLESEKASMEDRAKTRDCWARIDGIDDKVRWSQGFVVM